MSIIQTMKKEILQPEKHPQFPLLILLPERIATGTLLCLGLWLSGSVYMLLYEKPHLLTLLRLDCAVLSLLLILPETKLLRYFFWSPIFSNIAWTCYFELRRLASIHKFLTCTATATLVSAFVL